VSDTYYILYVRHPLRCQTYKKLQAGKPDSVALLRCARKDESLRFASWTKSQSGYHLSVSAVTRGTQAAYPVTCPAEAVLGRAVLGGYYMWHFSMQGLPAIDVTIKSCELLPHIFTLTPALSTSREGGQLFSVALSVPACAGPGSSPVHCSALSGLSSLPGSGKAIAWLVAMQK